MFTKLIWASSFKDKDDFLTKLDVIEIYSNKLLTNNVTVMDKNISLMVQRNIKSTKTQQSITKNRPIE